MLKFLGLIPLREGDGVGGGAAGAGAGAAGAAAGGAGVVPPAGGAGAALWKRDFLPDSVYGASNEESFGKLADAWRGLRDDAAKRPPPGKSADDYVFDASKNEKIAPYFKNASDPLMKVARETALKAGLPPAQFGQFVTGLYEAAADAKLLGPVYSPESEARAIAERLAPGKPWGEQKPVVEKALKDAESFGKVLGDQLKLSDGAKDLLGALIDEAAGVELISALAGAMSQQPGFGVPGAEPAGGGWTKESLDKAIADPRYSPLAREFDKAFRERIDAGFRQLYGN